MTDPAAILGTFADFKVVKTRSTAQFVIEVPLHEADAALKALGGVPQPGIERWVGIARVREGQKTQDAVDTVAPTKPRPWSTLTPREQAVIRCGDEGFRKWVMGAGWDVPDWQTSIRLWLLDECNIESRADLNTNPEAATRWRELDSGS